MLWACAPERRVEPAASTHQRTAFARAAPLDQARRIRTSDDDLAELADRLPGFGGYYYDEQQRLTVWLKDLGRAAEAQAMVADFLRRRMARTPALAAASAQHTEGMRVRQASHDFRQLLTWYRGHVLSNVMQLPGITMTDIDERKNRIQIGVASAEHLEATRRFVARLPLPAGVVEVLIEQPAIPSRAGALDLGRIPFAFTTQHLSDTLRPVVGGARILIYDPGGYTSCTLGFNLQRWVDNEIQPQRYFTTAGHCLLDWGTMSSRSVAQPIASKYIGVEVADPSFFSCAGVHPNVPASYSCRHADVGLVLYDSASHADPGRVATPGLGQTSFSSTASITEVFAPEVGRLVEMVGASSGRLVGTVDRSCAHVRYASEQKFLLCQARASYAGGTGDSGAPVIERFGDGSTAWGVGIHWSHTSAGDSWFSPLYSALNELYATSGLLDPTTSPSEPPVLPRPPADFEVSIYGMTLVGPTTECSWTAVVTGGESPLEYTWTDLLNGTDYYVYGSMTTTGYLHVTVVDALGVERTASLLIDYDPEANLDCM